MMTSGWSIEATADRFHVDARTVRKWRDRFVAEGPAGLFDRSSRPHRSPMRACAAVRRRVLQLRRRRRWDADRIAPEVRLAPSTVQKILNAAGCGRLDRVIERRVRTRSCATNVPGELIPPVPAATLLEGLERIRASTTRATRRRLVVQFKHEPRSAPPESSGSMATRRTARAAYPRLGWLGRAPGRSGSSVGAPLKRR
jgi:hypothetical protein